MRPAIRAILLGPSVPRVAWDPIVAPSFYAFALDNRQATSNGAAAHGVRSLVSRSAGKWYAEVVRIGLSSNETEIGFALSTFTTNYVGSDGNSWGWYQGGGIYHNASPIQGTDTYAADDTLMLAIDINAGKMWWGKNGTWTNSGNPTLGTGANYTGPPGVPYFVAANVSNSNGVSVTLSKTQTYRPAGFRSW